MIESPAAPYSAGMKRSQRILLALAGASMLACGGSDGPDPADTESATTEDGTTGTPSTSASATASTSASTSTSGNETSSSSEESSTGEPSTGEPSTGGESSSSSGEESSSSTGAAALYEILDPDMDQFGMSSQEWAGAWWQWVFGLPATDHPLLDDTGMNCGVGQSGSVFFLAGTLGGPSVMRTCTATADTAFFFPIANVTADNAGFPEEEWYTDEELEAYAVAAIDGLDDFELEIDGDTYDMAALAEHRVGLYQSTYTVPDEDSLLDLFGLPVDVVGLVDPTFGDGIYVMVQFEPGEHDIHFHAEDADIGFSTDVTYALTVE